MQFPLLAIRLLCGVSLPVVAAADRTTAKTSTGVYACGALSALLPGEVNYPNSTSYMAENIYWSDRQNEVNPACFVTPRSTADVSSIVGFLTSSRTPFTVKSGGHTAFPGGSNIDQGVTIDLLHMNEITVAPDAQTVSVGPGNRWIHVTEALDPRGLAVVGGRVADVGVSGLLLGGGISYFSGAHGWGCDNVRRYELVLASGAVVTASPNAHADLYWALRGGGGASFGVVTRFDLAAFPQRELWASDVLYPGALNTTLVPLFAGLTRHGLARDPGAHSYLVFVHAAELGGFAVLTSMYHATPLPANATPAVFAPFKAVPGILSDTSTVGTVSAALRAIKQPYGDRQTWWDTSVLVTESTLLTDIVPLWEKVVATLLSAAEQRTLPNGTSTTVTPYLVYQPLSVNILTAMQQNGGNALGLKPSDGPMMIVQLTVVWDDAELDGLIEDQLSSLIQEIESMAEEREELKGFVYMNYAGQTQEVLKRYGPDNFERLKSVAKKYDPDQLLQQYWKGYFQVDGVEQPHLPRRS